MKGMTIRLTPAEFVQIIKPRRNAVLSSRNGPHRVSPLPPRIQQPKPQERTQNGIKLKGKVNGVD